MQFTVVILLIHPRGNAMLKLPHNIYHPRGHYNSTCCHPWAKQRGKGIVCKGFETHPFYFYSTLYIKPHSLQKQTNPPFCRSCFSKINMMQIYTTPLNTTIFLTSKSFRCIKLVWIWKISKWLKLFKYITPLNTTIFLTSKSFRCIKLVWIWKISKWLKLFKYINLTQNKIIIFALMLMHNIRTHPFYFWYTLYTQTPFFTVKPINPPFYPFFRSFQTHSF